MKKLSLDYLAHILVIFQSLQDFTYLASNGLLYRILVDLASHHIVTKSFENLQESPNNCFFMKKLSFVSL